MHATHRIATEAHATEAHARRDQIVPPTICVGQGGTAFPLAIAALRRCLAFCDNLRFFIRTTQLKPGISKAEHAVHQFICTVAGSSAEMW